MVLWVSRDQGDSWQRVRQLTHDRSHNHNYARRPLDARADFYALWADGHGRRPSPSCLYFTDRDGSHVWRLPPKMNAEEAVPEVVW